MASWNDVPILPSNTWEESHMCQPFDHVEDFPNSDLREKLLRVADELLAYYGRTRNSGHTFGMVTGIKPEDLVVTTDRRHAEYILHMLHNLKGHKSTIITIDNLFSNHQFLRFEGRSDALHIDHSLIDLLLRVLLNRTQRRVVSAQHTHNPIPSRR